MTNYYIESIEGRGNEIIELLESKGFHNNFNLDGNSTDAVYYTDNDYNIRCIETKLSYIIKQFCVQLKLPKIENWKPKYKVGDYVVWKRELNNNYYDRIKRIEEIDYQNRSYLLSNTSFLTTEDSLSKWKPKRGETVLVSPDNSLPWGEAIFSYYNNDSKLYGTVGNFYWKYCIPFDIYKLGKVTD